MAVKFLKDLLFLVVLVVIVVAPLIVVQILDPNDTKWKSPRIGNATGRTVEIADLELTAIPGWVTTGTTTIGNAPGFDSPYFAKFEQAEIRADLMGLLRQEMRMDTVSLSGGHLQLARKADGTTNWDDLTQARRTKRRQRPAILGTGTGPISSTASLTGRTPSTLRPCPLLTWRSPPDRWISATLPMRAWRQTSALPCAYPTARVASTLEETATFDSWPRP